MNIRFVCSSCKQASRWEKPGSMDWQCHGCDNYIPAFSFPANNMPACLICGNRELYKKKDFPHWLGLTILTTASLLFLAANNFYLQKLAWAILIGSALVDGLLYFWVGDVVVCYRCEAHHRGFPGSGEQKPFELGIAERYRQERLRREQLQKGES